ncbi:MAG: hypothetical protein NW226_09510 [Microscillaceae bacterium]|nr:hypothetical protein [Microscillaceae bacterium]
MKKHDYSMYLRLLIGFLLLVAVIPFNYHRGINNFLYVAVIFYIAGLLFGISTRYKLTQVWLWLILPLNLLYGGVIIWWYFWPSHDVLLVGLVEYLPASWISTALGMYTRLQIIHKSVVKVLFRTCWEI